MLLHGMIMIVSRVFQGPDEMRKIAVPAHRYTPLKENWLKIFTPIVENLQLQVRFNLKTRNVEIKVSFRSPSFEAVLTLQHGPPALFFSGTHSHV